jgi:ADP-heptose:LPS heptosyltransferase
VALRGSDILGENLGRGAVREVWVRFPRQLGDVIFSLPFFGTLQARWNAVADAKGASLRWVAVGHAIGAALFSEAKPEFIARSLIEKGGQGKPEPLALRKAWREVPPVAVINLSQSARLALAARMAGVPIRAGIADNRLRLLYTHPFKYRDLDVHCALRFAPLLELLTGDRRLDWVRLGPHNLGGEGGLDLLRSAGWDGRPYVCLAFGTRGDSKRWRPERELWPDLARRLLAQGLGVLWLGGPDEVALGAELAALAPGSQDLCGRTTLPEATAIQSRAYGTVAIDTGLAHTGAATGRPLVCINVHSAEGLVAPQGPNVVLLRPPVIALDPAEPPRDYEYRSDRVHPGRVLNLLHALAGEAAGRALEPFLP